MIDIIPKQIRKEYHLYYSEKPISELKSAIQQLFDKSEDWNFSINLIGQFTSDTEFYMTPKWQFASIKNFEREISFLKGQLLPAENGKTIVKFSVRPNSVFAIMLFAFLFFGLAILGSGQSNRENIIAGLVFILVVPLTMLFIAQNAKQSIKDRFVKTFGLKLHAQETEL